MEAASNVPVGIIKTFGIGPKYQVGQPIRRLEDGDWLVSILLIETGERAEYPLAQILSDPGGALMYAVAFDLVVADTNRHHPKGVAQAYTEIGSILADRGFARVQGSLYVTDDEDMANLFMAMQELRARSWFPKSVRDIRAFRIEQWSDFTSVVKGARPSRPLGVREPDAVYAA